MSFNKWAFFTCAKTQRKKTLSERGLHCELVSTLKCLLSLSVVDMTCHRTAEYWFRGKSSHECEFNEQLAFSMKCLFSYFRCSLFLTDHLYHFFFLPMLGTKLYCVTAIHAENEFWRCLPRSQPPRFLKPFITQFLHTLFLPT